MRASEIGLIDLVLTHSNCGVSFASLQAAGIMTRPLSAGLGLDSDKLEVHFRLWYDFRYLLNSSKDQQRNMQPVEKISGGTLVKRIERSMDSIIYMTKKILADHLT